jgi:glycyl-tRNA synthetase
MNPTTWKASGHLESFTDPLVDCKKCKHRFKLDDIDGSHCPDCGGELTEARSFNLMFKTFVGPVEDDASVTYLRPETAQGIFVNFLNVQKMMRRKIPFGIAQIGKAFRNEITPGNFTFRTREFEQMEIEYFVKPGTDEECYKRWGEERFNWYIDLGIKREHLRLREHEHDELAHYAKSCVDIEYLFPMGWSELEGIANRGDFDLSQHSQHSGKELSYFDEATKEKFIPYVIEPSAGADRATLAFLIDAYREEKVRGEKRVVLALQNRLAPIKVAVLPLLRNRSDIVETAKAIASDLRGECRAVYDDTASIGRLYRRQDEVGTPYCITVDVQSMDDHQVTVRDRDSMQQVRVPIEGVKAYLKDCLAKSELVGLAS